MTTTAAPTTSLPLPTRPPVSVSGRRAAGVAVLVMMGTLLLQIAWILSVAPFAGIDEIDHVFRASSVADGHLLASERPVAQVRGRGDLIPVQADIAAAARTPCQALTYNGPDNCVPVATSGGGDVLIASSASRYDPVFYVLVGNVANPFHGRDALYAMRLTSAVLCSLLLTAAAYTLVRRGGRGWSLLSLLVATTPTTLYSTSIAAPNGLNIVSGAGLWVALIGLFVDPTSPDPRSRRLLLGLGVLSASLLVTTHTLGALWLVLSVLAVLLTAGPRRVRARVVEAPRPYVLSTAIVLLATLAAVSWVLLVRANDPSGDTGAGSYGHHPFPIVLIGLLLWPLQAIAAFPSRSQAAEPGVYALVLIPVVILLVTAWRRATTRLRCGVAVLLVAFYVIPLVLTVLTYADLGLAWQGRYALPLVIGIALLLGLSLDLSGRRMPRGVAVAVPLALVAAQVVSWHSTIERLLQRHVWRASTVWNPPSAALLLALAGAALACWIGASLLTRRVDRCTPGATPREPAQRSDEPLRQ